VDDVLAREGLVGQEVPQVLGLQVKLVHGLHAGLRGLCVSFADFLCVGDVRVHCGGRQPCCPRHAHHSPPSSTRCRWGAPPRCACFG
jgi:hypothetical protein